MLKLLANFWHDERGSVPVTEWMLVATILTLGALAAVWSIHRLDGSADDNPPTLISSLLVHK